jgi:sulfur relay (sulfurtransferase) DsrC/TusE family protein
MSTKNAAVEEKLVNQNSETKQYFISDEKFELLKQYQQAIFEATETSPALRKIVNALITVENLEKVKANFIQVWQQN